MRTKSIVAAGLAAFAVHRFRDTDTFGFVWSQKTPYTAPEPNHAAHITRAEAKRRRKAEKLARVSHPSGGDRHGE